MARVVFVVANAVAKWAIGTTERLARPWLGADLIPWPVAIPIRILLGLSWTALWAGKVGIFHVLRMPQSREGVA